MTERLRISLHNEQDVKNVCNILIRHRVKFEYHPIRHDTSKTNVTKIFDFIETLGWNKETNDKIIKHIHNIGMNEQYEINTITTHEQNCIYPAGCNTKCEESR